MNNQDSQVPEGETPLSFVDSSDLTLDGDTVGYQANAPKQGLNDFQLRQLIIVPTLSHLGELSDAAVALLLNTARQESRLSFLTQLSNGPARGLWQMEPATHDDIWQNFLAYRDELAAKVRMLAIGTRKVPDAEQMVGNLFYACAMARVHYLRVPQALPEADDLEGQAHYWKTYYNTHAGRGTVEEFLEKADMLV